MRRYQLFLTTDGEARPYGAPVHSLLTAKRDLTYALSLGLSVTLRAV